MRVECPTCHSAYKVGDEKVAGKTVKIRCKRCHAVLVINGPAHTLTPTPTPAPALGERNEASVLFSLSALVRQHPASPPSSPPPSTRLSDDAILGLSAGGPFAFALAPPVLPVSVAPPPRERSRRTWLAAVAGACIAACIAPLPLLFHHTRVGATTPEVHTGARVAAPIETTTPAATAPVALVDSAAPTSTAIATPTRSLPRRADATPTATTAPSAPRPSRCCAGESDAACEMRRAVGDACPELPAFDCVAALQALQAVEVSSCRGASGSGHVKVRFEPDGSVSSAAVDTGPLVGTSGGACVARRFRAVRIPAFSGAAVTAGKSFALP